MEDGAKENTALNIQKPLEILVTDEDKHGTDIACMSDFFGIYIEQLSAELSNQVMRGVVEKIPAADVQILGELVHGVDVLLSGKYGYIPDFDSLPNDVKDKLKKGIYTLGESRQVEDNVRAVVLDENGTRIKDVTLKRVLNTPDTLEMSRSITSQVQMRQIAAKLDEIAETQSYLIEMERNNNIIKPFLNARDLILRAQNAKTIDERKHYMIEASKELNDVINASRLDLKTSSEHLAKLTRFPILRNSSQIKNYMGYVAQDLQLTTKYVGVQMHVLDYLGDYETANEVLSSYQMMLSDFADRPINKKNQSTAILMQNNSTYSEQTQDYWLNFRIMDMFEADNVTYPIKAFFGELLERPRRTKAYPIALINKNINLDQLLAINNAMKYPLAYIQGPPGTGKTNTIINTIVTAFFNNVTVLFASYNNVPIDNVFEKLSSMKYRGKTIPFPVLRLGNTEKVMEAIKYINELRTQVQSLQIFASTLDKRKDDRIDRAKRLSARLKEYEEILDLKERKETLTHLMKYQEHMKNTMKLLPFQTDLQGYQMQKLDKRIAAIGEISDADAMQLLDRNEDEFYQYLFYTSARYIKALEEPKFQELRQILDSDETPEKLVNEFNKYMRKSENVRKLQRVFPIIITTCISAHKIGEPEPLFDMTIMDEASQCNVAISLVPIIRGEKLMLVGDPQQLNPVILLGELTNKKLRRRYHVSDEYDYRENSIYKTYLACDAVSDEVLLRNHYRCNKEIIGFNNKKYYN